MQPDGPPVVLVVRPRAQALAWVAELEAVGVAARALPLIDILPAPDPAQVAAQAAAIARPVAGELEPLLVFVSPNAVEGFLAAAGLPAWPAHAWAAATGPGTVAALRVGGVPAVRIVAPAADSARFDSEALWARVDAWPWHGRAVWLVRGNGGRDWLGERLRAAGARVQVLQSYERAAPRLDANEQAMLADAIAAPARHAWLFGSSESIDHLAALAPGVAWAAARALATHPRIAERTRALGFGRVETITPSPAAVAQALST